MIQQTEESRLGYLRAIKDEEVALMLSWRNAPNVRANMYTTHEISLLEHLAWWQKVQSLTNQQYLMYEYMGAPTGIVAYNAINQENQNSFWAFYASPDAQSGAGSRMEFLALEYAFNSLGLHKLCCEVLAFNKAVIKLHEKFGFQIEGILREQHKVKGEFVDIYKLGVMASEWAVKRNEMLVKILRTIK